MAIPVHAPQTMRLSAETRRRIRRIVNQIIHETDERGIPCPGRVTTQEIVDVALTVLLDTDPKAVVRALVDRRLRG